MPKRIILRNCLASLLLFCSFAVNAERFTIPLLVPAGATSDPQGVIRILNDAQESATVTIHAIDDAGVRTGPATLMLDALAAVELSATELESGNAAKGLSAGLGSLSGDARLVIDSDVPVVPSAYVRNADGTLAAMNATVLEAAGAGLEAYRYDVPVFHPASNATQPSRLRLINPGESAARVTIAARDDAGAAATGGTVELTLPAGGARTLSAQQLEVGDSAALTGRLGAGVGNWRLSVTSDRPIQAVNVTVTPGTGRWSNLSTTAVAGWAPESEAAFEARFLDLTVVFRDGRERTEWRVLAGNRLSTAEMEDGVESVVEAAYRYERIGRDAGRLSFQPDGGARCEMRVYFESPTSGWHAFGCVENVDRVEYWTGGTWVALDAGATPLDLGAGPDDLTYTVGTSIESLTLPAASGGEGALTYSLLPQVSGLNFDPPTRRLSGTPTEAGEHLMTYRVRDASGDTDWRYFNIAVEAATGGGETSHGVGDTLSGLPTGTWAPELSGGGSVLISGGVVTVDLDDGSYFEHGGRRYTCQSAGGCTIENRSVTSGTVVQTAAGTAPGGGVSGDHGDERATATEVEAGSDTEGVLESGDVDYFRIVVDAPGTLEVYSTGNTDTFGYLEDDGGETLRSNDDGGASTNFRIEEDVSAGTYFVRVRGYNSRTTGDYTLHMRFTESDTGTTPPGGGQETTFGVGDTLSGLPTGTWAPNISGGGSHLITGSGVTLRLNDASYFEHDDHRYTCQSSGGCVIENRRVTSGTVVQTASGTVPGGTPSGVDGSALGDFDLHDDNDSQGGIAHANGRLYVADHNDKVYVYTLEGQPVAAANFDLHPEISAFGITHANGQLYVVDGFDGEVYVYTVDGQHVAAPLFDLQDENFSPRDIAHTNGRLYVVDDEYEKVYVYTVEGQPVVAANFDLHNDNDWPMGIAHANGRLYVVDTFDDKVYAYTIDGQREAAADFDLHDDNDRPGGIAYGNGRFYVVDSVDDKVYAYTVDGQRLGSEDSSPRFTGSGPDNQTYTVGTTISELTLPAASGGDGALTYSLSPTVPGLIFNATASARRLSGTPTTAGRYDMTYRVRDSNGNTDSLSFTITVEASGGGGQPPAPGNLRLTRTGDNIRVSWDRSPGADYYEVWRCNDSVFNCNLPASWSRRATVTGTSWLDTNLPTPAPGISVRLRYLVQACNSAGCSGQLK